MIKGIVCKNRLGYIGKNNDLMYELKDDLRRFKNLTDGGIIIMGKNTYLSLPKGPLPNRLNIVITDEKIVEGDLPSNLILAKTLNEALQKANFSSVNTGENIWIIGGAYLFDSARKLIDEWHLTTVKDDEIGDVKLSDNTLEDIKDNFEVVSVFSGEDNGFDYVFEVYRRKK